MSTAVQSTIQCHVMSRDVRAVRSSSTVPCQVTRAHTSCLGSSASPCCTWMHLQSPCCWIEIHEACVGMCVGEWGVFRRY